MRKFALGVSLLVLPVLLVAPSAAGAAITCHQTASPTGTITTAQGLVDALTPGQTGCLRAGTYVGTVAVNKSVTLTSYGGENAIVRGRIVVTGAGARIEKLMLDGRNGANEASPTIHAPDVVLRDNDIQNVSTSAICVNVKTSGTLVPDRFLIERNRIHHCGSLPYTNLLHGLMLENGTGGIVQDNVIYANADKGLLLYPNLQSATIRRNTVDGNGEGIHFGEATANTRVENNIAANSTRRWNIESYNLFGPGNVVQANCVWGSNASTSYNSRGGVMSGLENYLTLGTNPVAQPGYANRAAGDFSVPAGAGCAGYGAPSTVAGLAPDTVIESGPSGTISSTSATFEFSSTRPGATFECRTDSPSTGTWQPCTSPHTLSGLVAGTTYTFNVRAKLGTVTDPSPASRSVTPATVPDTTITAGPSGVTNNASPSFSFTASPSSGATFECSMDGAAYEPCTSPKAYSVLPNGAHVFRVRAKNGAGTDATPAERSFTVDTVSPDTTITAAPSAPTSSPSFSFTATETGSTFECRLDGPGLAVGTYGSCTSPKAYAALAAGDYTFRVRAKDAATNVDGTPATHAFTSPSTTVTCHKIAAPNTAIDSANDLHNALAAGQTGCFRAGTYGVGTDYIEVGKANLTFRNYPGESATVKGHWGMIDAGSGSKIEGLTLDFGEVAACCGIFLHGNDITIRNNEITARDKSVICVHPSSDPQRFLIQGNRIHDCGRKVSRAEWSANKTAYNHTHGIYVESGNGTIRDNVVYDNMTRGIQLYPRPNGVTILNNTIDGNGFGVSFDQSGGVTANNVVRNNVVTNSNIEFNAYSFAAVTGTGNEFAFNCAFASSEWADANANGGIQSPMPGVNSHDNTVADPGYTNRAAKDFRFSNAACAGKGAPASVANPVGFPAP